MFALHVEWLRINFLHELLLAGLERVLTRNLEISAIQAIAEQVLGFQVLGLRGALVLRLVTLRALHSGGELQGLRLRNLLAGNEGGSVGVD